MYEIVFVITFVAVVIGYSLQLIKIIKKKSSKGVSFQAWFITFIAASIITFNADAESVFIIASSEVLLSILGMFLIFLYRSQNSEKATPVFFIALFASFFMVHGVMQAIESYRHIGRSNVSIGSYSTWILLDVMVIYLAEDLKIMFALGISIFLYLYIVIATFLKNKKAPEELQLHEKKVLLEDGREMIYCGGGMYGAIDRIEQQKRKKKQQTGPFESIYK